MEYILYPSLPGCNFSKVRTSKIWIHNGWSYPISLIFGIQTNQSTKKIQNEKKIRSFFLRCLPKTDSYVQTRATWPLRSPHIAKMEVSMAQRSRRNQRISSEFQKFITHTTFTEYEIWYVFLSDQEQVQYWSQPGWKGLVFFVLVFSNWNAFVD